MSRTALVRCARAASSRTARAATDRRMLQAYAYGGLYSCVKLSLSQLLGINGAAPTGRLRATLAMRSPSRCPVRIWAHVPRRPFHIRHMSVTKHFVLDMWGTLRQAQRRVRHSEREGVLNGSPVRGTVLPDWRQRTTAFGRRAP